ncbi:glutathione S-transferase [Mycena amicta]|nr:glutathione S-transferase [Mycena amicta]
MVLKLYCTSRAGGGSGIVALVLTEKNIPFEFVPVDIPNKANKTSEFMDSLHPFGQVPVIDDDGFILYESRAIARYLESKYPGQGATFVPRKEDGIQATARFEQAMSVEMMDGYPGAVKIAVETLFKSRKGSEVDEAKVAETIAKFEEVLDAYERILKKTKYLAGDELTLADLFHLQLVPVLTTENLKMDLMGNVEKRPNVARWWKELVNRPAWLKLVADGIKSTV